MLSQGLSKELLFQRASVEKYISDELRTSRLKATCGRDDQIGMHPKKQERHLKETSLTQKSPPTLKGGHKWSEFGTSSGLRSVTLELGLSGFKFGLPGGSDGKASVYNARDLGSISGSGRSTGEENGSPLQHYCLENPMDRGAWQAAVYGVAQSQIRLSDFTSIHCIGKGSNQYLSKFQMHIPII